ncbi:hypothetical protein EIP86_010003 [Pleurotus ostreatoroseus]|nr:hypothetical protein EIP86_010003 [Pleurotus ostreatoroseus]
MLSPTQAPRSASSGRVVSFTPISTTAETRSSSSPSPPSTNSSGHSTPRRTQLATPRPRTRSHRHLASLTRPRAASAAMAYQRNPAYMFTSASAGPSAASTSALPPDPGSPPPYTPEPDPNVPILSRRSASSPHLQSHNLGPRSFSPQVQSHTSSRRQSSAALQSLPHASGAHLRHRPGYAAVETEDDRSESSGDDGGVTYQSSGPSLAGSLRERLFGKGKGRADSSERLRPITTAPGVIGAGETETEGEDPVS